MGSRTPIMATAPSANARTVPIGPACLPLSSASLDAFSSQCAAMSGRMSSLGPSGILGDGSSRRVGKDAEERVRNRCRSPPLVQHFLRKTKKTDTNMLEAVRAESSHSTVSETGSPHGHSAEAHDPANLLYTLTFQPISRSVNLVPSRGDAPSGQSRAQVWQTPHRLVVICLGSTTLEELRAMLAAREGIPAEAPDSDNEDASDERAGIEQETLDLTGTFGGSKQDEGASEKRIGWRREARITGSCFAIDGVLYADADVEEEGKVDYAQMVLDAIDSTDWPAHAPSAPRPVEQTPALAVGAHKPAMRRGPPMRDTVLAELDGVKTRTPYWFVTQGNAEIVWSVDEIRYRHPFDPAPSSTDDSRTYPLTVFHSRPPTSGVIEATSSGRCRLCDRDPGVIVVINDELVGDTPALVCEACWDALHPLRDNEDGAVFEERMDAADLYRQYLADEVRVVPSVP
ncbi:hypothetical protein JCM10207_007325 [Rhodosporidiobolus poonsookiae]